MTEREKQAVNYLRAATAELIREQIAFAEIACPDYRASQRAEHLIRAWREAGLSPKRDKAGNVVALRRGAAPRTCPTLILVAHMDSVFYNVKDIRVRRRGRILYAPGISDNAAGVANLILLARALSRFAVRTAGDILFVGSVGEEGEGGLKGMRHFFRANRFANALFISIDGGSPGGITRKALASWSPKIVVRGPGGHSYSNFGRPNPVHVLARFIAKVTTLSADRDRNVAYNANVISGGTAVNVIPDEARVTLNMRSSDVRVLARLKKSALRFLGEAREEELAWATSDKSLEVTYTALARPGGETPEDHPLVRAMTAAVKAEGITPRFPVISTDANMPMSLGIPAINVSAGGTAGNVHSTKEWHDTTGRTKDLAALARAVFALVG